MSVLTSISGCPSVGRNRELKKIIEAYSLRKWGVHEAELIAVLSPKDFD